jgi:two-component system, oxyanion-binding sensor
VSEPRFVGAPVDLLLGALSGRLQQIPGEAQVAVPNYFVPQRSYATFPWTSHALWYYSQMVRWQQIEYDASHLPAVRATYRPDLYRLALAPIKAEVPSQDTKIENAYGQASGQQNGFFDGREFDPESFDEYLAGQPFA